jgi:Thiol-activated cytolysin
MPARRAISKVRILAHVVVVVGAVGIAGFVGCTDKSPSGLRTASAGVNDFFLGLPGWEEFSPTSADADSIIGQSVGTVEDATGEQYNCTTTPYSITSTPDKVVTLDPDANILWLGALLQGDGYKDGIGSLQEWTVRERAPVKVSIDLLDGDNTRTVANPDLASVNQAIGELVAKADWEGHKGGSSVSFDEESQYSIKQAMLKLGISAGYASVSVKASLSASRTAAERTITAYFVQKMFTASVVLPSQPGELFTSAFTPARLQEEEDRGNVGPSNLPVYIANIVYGRILMFSFTSTSNITDIRAALAASFSSIAGAEIEARYLNILNNAKISVVTIGGEGKNATALIQSGQLKDYFNEDAALTSARPISFTIRNVGDNSIAKVTETTDYNLKECTAIGTTGTLSLDVSPNDATVSVSGPASYTFGPSNGDQFLDTLPPGGYTIKVTHAGYDSLVVDTSVTVGDTTSLVASLVPLGSLATGAFYTLTLKSLQIDQVGCSGENQPDLYWTITANGQNIDSKARTSSVSLYAGQSTPLTGTFADTIRKSITLAVSLHDADPLNADDPMGNKTATWTFPSIPTGPNLGITINNVSGCSSRVNFSITKGVDVYTP